MNANSVYLALAPNILRKTVQDLDRLGLDLDLIPPQTHQEMQDFARAYGQDGPVPGLTVCAYPEFLYNALALQEAGGLAELPDTLPPMRGELTAQGMAEPSAHLRVICYVPFVIASANGVAPAITDWEDLCRPDVSPHVAVPPHDTPLPELFDAMMTALCGERAAGVMAAKNTDYTPLDINKHVDAGEFKAGISIPAFSKTYRQGNGHLVWPRSGAWPVPLVAAMRTDAPADALAFLDYLLSTQYQTYLSESGALVPVVEGVPWFPEMAENNARLNWPGWDALFELGRPKTA